MADQTAILVIHLLERSTAKIDSSIWPLRHGRKTLRLVNIKNGICSYYDFFNESLFKR